MNLISPYINKVRLPMERIPIHIRQSMWGMGIPDEHWKFIQLMLRLGRM